MPIIGHVSKLVFGWAVGESANRTLALQAWRMAKETMRQLNIDPAGMVMHQDQDPVYTSYAWTGRLLLRDHLQVSYSLDGRDGGIHQPFQEREPLAAPRCADNRSVGTDS